MIKRKKAFILIAVFACVFILWHDAALAQCVMCKAMATDNGMANPEEARSLNNGILYILFIPYILMASMALLYFWYRKRHKKSQQA